MMKRYTYILLFIVSVVLNACMPDAYIGGNDNGNIPGGGDTPEDTIDLGGESLIICCEGNWQSDNGQLAFYNGKTGKMINTWFRNKNNMKLGDTPNDIIQVNDTLFAIAVNWSNIIQFIRPDGTACGATEDIPNNRRMCSDGRYLYITSYAHVCREESFEKGFVAKVDVRTKKIVATCEVGWEPEGIKLYDGRLYIANSGGYSFSEAHDYETTISVVDANTMQVVDEIDTGCPNLYGDMSQAGRYLCINSAGDYYNVGAQTVILNCKTGDVNVLNMSSTCNTTDGELFYCIGSNFTYGEGDNTINISTIDPVTLEVTETIYNAAITEKIKSLGSPYCIYVSPYTKNIYFTDAAGYDTSGTLYGYDKDGNLLFEPQETYVNPGHIVAVKR